MKIKFILIIVFLVLNISTIPILAQESKNSKTDWPVLKGPYLGQEPPGMKVEIFAPGIISTEHNESFFGFSENGRFLIINQSGIKFLELKHGTWTSPQKVPFDTDADFYYTTAPKGKIVYFLSTRPLEKGGAPSEFRNIWRSRKLDKGWSEPKLLANPLNANGHIGCPSFTNNGSIYFYSSRLGGFGSSDIYSSRLVNNKYTELKNIGNPPNTRFDEADPFIALDKSFLLFVSKFRPGGLGGFDIYISYKNHDNSWTEPVNIGGTINSKQNELSPRVSYDSKYLFFTSYRRGNADIYWVDAKIIEELKPEELR